MCARPALAQQFSVVPVDELRFGTLMQGVPTRVAPTDAASRADLHVNGKGRMTLVVVLPATVNSAGGQAIPLQFGANDGLYQIGTGSMLPFDPRSPLTITVPNSAASVTLYIGGTALPSLSQAPGSYAATLTVQAFK